MLAATSLRCAARQLSRRPPSVAVVGANAPQQLQLQRRGYHENIVEHYENPQNVGSLDKNDENVGTVSDILGGYCNSCLRLHDIFDLRCMAGGDDRIILWTTLLFQVLINASPWDDFRTVRRMRL